MHWTMRPVSIKTKQGQGFKSLTGAPAGKISDDIQASAPPACTN
jgi:hypothetical protein